MLQAFHSIFKEDSTQILRLLYFVLKQQEIPKKEYQLHKLLRDRKINQFPENLLHGKQIDMVGLEVLLDIRQYIYNM